MKQFPYAMYHGNLRLRHAGRFRRKEDPARLEKRQTLCQRGSLCTIDAMKTNRVLSNAVWMIGCRVVESVLHLVIIMLTSRYLGPANYGIINYAASLVAFVLPLMQLGIRNIMIKEMVDAPEQRGAILGTGLCMNLISSVLCVIGVTAFALVANPGEPQTVIVCLLYSTCLLFEAVQILKYWFQEKLMGKYISLSMLAAYVLVTAYQLVILVNDCNVLWFAFTDSVKHLFIAVFLVLLYRHFRADELRLSWTVCKRLLASGRYYILSNMMVTVFAQTDKIMLKQMMGDAATGYYAAAVNCTTLTSFLFIAILDSVRPGVFQSRRVDYKDYEKRVTQLYAVIAAVAVLQCVGVTIFAPLVVRILYGMDYAPTIPLLQMVIWYTVFAYLGQVRDIWMLAEEKQSLLWKLNLFGALANVALNLALIPGMGAAGAAVASLVSQFIANVGVCIMIPSIRRSGVLMARGCHPKVFMGMLRGLK